MIVYHGSHFHFTAPDYAELVDAKETRGFPLGMWASPRREVARLFGPHVYEMTLDCIPTMVRNEDLLSRPRHIHIRDGRDVIITENNHVVIINFDTIVDFRYVGNYNLERIAIACSS